MSVASRDLALAAIAGLLSHLLYFNRGEHHLYGSLYALCFTSAVALVASTCYLQPSAFPFTIRDTILAAASYLGGLYSSIAVYRILFHPLRTFPGPTAAKWSTLWLSTQLAKGDAHKRVLQLHQKYGDFVRVGSSDLSIIHSAGVQAVYGSKSKCVKGAWYDLTYPMISLQTLRDKERHHVRRRVWSEAFSDKALAAYEDRMKTYRAKLLRHIESCADNSKYVDVAKWFNFYTFDVMGDLAFGSSFKMLDTSEQHWSLTLLQAGLKPLSFHLPIWLFRLFLDIPGIGKDWFRFMAYCRERLDERISAKDGKPDIMAALLKAPMDKFTATERRKLLEGDSQLIIVAGSDTTAVTLTSMVYELLRAPKYIDMLRDELAPFVQGDVIDFRRIQTLPLLNGIVNETHRLHPPVPTTLSRRTPSEGIMVGDTHVPGNMTVWCPQYAIGRTESLYKDAGTFFPERWYSRPDTITDKTVFAPFSVGAYACIGKSLALQNIRNTIAEIVMNFEIRTGVVDDVRSFEDKTLDHFTMGLPALRVYFDKRGC